MLRTVRSCLPAVEIPTARDVWVGLRPSAPDSLPFLGRVARYANVSVAAGHGHVGMGLAPAGGEMIAQIITRGPMPKPNHIVSSGMMAMIGIAFEMTI